MLHLKEPEKEIKANQLDISNKDQSRNKWIGDQKNNRQDSGAGSLQRYTKLKNIQPGSSRNSVAPNQ